MSSTCKGEYKRNYSRYYDTPDGCDTTTKMMVLGRYGAITGLVMSTYDVLMYSHAVGIRPMMRRYMYHTAPLTLMGATFAFVTNTVLNLRNKDDCLNYFLGGLACGPILAAYLGTYYGMIPGGILLGIGGILKKHGIDNDYTFFPPPRSHRGHIWVNKFDYTMAKDPLEDLRHTCGKSDNKKN